MTIEQEIRALIKYLDEECDQPYEEIFDQIIQLVNRKFDLFETEIERLKKQDADVIISYALERQKLIEGLRIMDKSDDEWYVGVIPMREFAKRVLKEIGVTTDDG